MERKKYLIRAVCACLCSLSPLASYGQKQYSSEIYSAYITGDMDRWERVIASMEASGTPTVASGLELAEYYYGYIGYLLEAGRKKEAGAYISKAESLTDDILTTVPSDATATSLKGIFIAYKMELNKLKTPVLGPQSMKLIKKAHRSDPRNVQAVSDMGNMYYNCPSVFGGDRTLGLRYLREAVGLMEERGHDRGNWFYLNLLTTLARYEAGSGSPAAARVIYEKILDLEPGFILVRDELYPRLVGNR